MPGRTVGAQYLLSHKIHEVVTIILQSENVEETNINNTPVIAYYVMLTWDALLPCPPRTAGGDKLSDQRSLAKLNLSEACCRPPGRAKLLRPLRTQVYYAGVLC